MGKTARERARTGKWLKPDGESTVMCESFVLLIGVSLSGFASYKENTFASLGFIKTTTLKGKQRW